MARWLRGQVRDWLSCAEMLRRPDVASPALPEQTVERVARRLEERVRELCKMVNKFNEADLKDIRARIAATNERIDRIEEKHTDLLVLLGAALKPAPRKRRRAA